MKLESVLLKEPINSPAEANKRSDKSSFFSVEKGFSIEFETGLVWIHDKKHFDYPPRIIPLANVLEMTPVAEIAKDVIPIKRGPGRPPKEEPSNGVQ